MTVLVALAMLGTLNLGFEEWGEGRAVGWTRGDGGRLTSQCEDTFEGRCAARLIRDRRAPGHAMTLTQQFAAYEAHGRTVALSGWVRTDEAAGAMAGLSIQVEGGGRELASAQNVLAGRVGPTEWQRVEIEVYVDPRAERIVMGATLIGRGSAWFDDFSLAVR